MSCVREAHFPLLEPVAAAALPERNSWGVAYVCAARQASESPPALGRASPSYMKTHSFSEFIYVCPEPVLVKRSF